MKFLETDYKQRPYDGKWERLAKVEDVENAYRYKTESGNVISLVPTKWITIGVYDYLFDMETE